MGAFSDIGAKIAQYAGDTVSGIGSGFGSLVKFGIKTGIGYGIGTAVNNAVKSNTGKGLQPGLAGLIGAFGVNTVFHKHNADTGSTWKNICKKVTIVATLLYGASQGIRLYHDKQAAENNLHERDGNEYLHDFVSPEKVAGTSAQSAPEGTAKASVESGRTADELVSGLQTTPDSGDTMEY